MKEVKRILSILMVLISATLLFPMKGAGQFGAKVGGNLSGAGSYGNSEEGETVGLKPGFQFGIFYDLPVGEKNKITIELNYEARGTISKKDYVIQYPVLNPSTGDLLGIGDYTVVQEANARQNYINLPILYVFGQKDFRFYVGPNLGLLLSAKADFTRTIDVALGGNALPGPPDVDISGLDWKDYDSFVAIFSPVNIPTEDGAFLKSLDLGVNVGAQYSISSQFFVDVRFNQGIIDISNNSYDSSIYPSEDFSFAARTDADRNASIQLSLGYKF